MIAWLTSAGDGWAVAPLWIAAGALLAVVAVLIGLRAERARQDREAHEARRQYNAAMLEQAADAVVERYLATGMTPDAVRKAAHGGPAWCAAVDRALERRGPTGTARSAVPRHRVAHPCPACGGALLSDYETLYYGQMVTCINCAAKGIVAYSADDPVSPEEPWPASTLAAHIEIYRSTT